MPVSKHINYIEFSANDLAATKTFFQLVFGWEFQDWGDEYCSFDAASSGLDGGFYKSELKSQAENGGALIVLYSDSIEQCLTSVKNSGGTIVKEIFEFPGGRRFHFCEPSGNELADWSDK